MPRIPTLKNLEDLVTEYHGNFSVSTLSYADFSVSTATNCLPARQSMGEGGEGRGACTNSQDVADHLGDGLDTETPRRTDPRLVEADGNSGVGGPGVCVSLL